MAKEKNIGSSQIKFKFQLNLFSKEVQNVLCGYDLFIVPDVIGDNSSTSLLMGKSKVFMSEKNKFIKQMSSDESKIFINKCQELQLKHSNVPKTINRMQKRSLAVTLIGAIASLFALAALTQPLAGILILVGAVAVTVGLMIGIGQYGKKTTKAIEAEMAALTIPDSFKKIAREEHGANYDIDHTHSRTSPTVAEVSKTDSYFYEDAPVLEAPLFSKNKNYAQLFLDHFSYRKTRIVTDNKELSNRLDEDARALRGQLQELAKSQHTLADTIRIVTNTIKQVRADRDKYVQSTKTVSQLFNNTVEACGQCNQYLVRRSHEVTPTFFAYKPASFERKTAYAMYQLSQSESAKNDLFTAIVTAFKTLGFKLGLWTPKTVPENPSIDQFINWMRNLELKKTQGKSYHVSTLDSCNSSVCNPPTEYTGTFFNENTGSADHGESHHHSHHHSHHTEDHSHSHPSEDHSHVHFHS